MIGLVIIAHRPLASAMAAGASHVYTCAPDKAESQVRVLDVAPDCDIDAAVAQARALVAEVDSGQGVLVLLDTVGATPGNIASKLADANRVAVVAGVNLPMLLRVLCYRENRLADVVEKALAGGIKGVVQVSATPPLQVQSTLQRGPQGNDLPQVHHQQ